MAYPLQKLCRLSHSSNKWRSPTDKSDEPRKTFAYENKFGMEDWLNRHEWTLPDPNTKNPIRYAHIQSLDTTTGKHIGQTFQLFFFCKKPKEKSKIIGMLNECLVISEEQAKNIAKKFRENGWLKLMINEVKRMRGTDTLFKRISDKPLWFFNIQFNHNDLIFFDNPKYIDLKTPRFNRAYLLENTSLSNYNHNGILVENTVNSQSLPKYSEEIRIRKAISKKSFSPRQAPIQNSLITELARIFPESTVKAEHHKVDIVININNNPIFIEIKCLNDARESIRHSIGQLLEYSHYSKKNKTKMFIIVSDNKAMGKDIDYLNNLTDLYKLNFRYLYWPNNVKSIKQNKIIQFKDFFTNTSQKYLAL
ncbi:MAG: hypothetical protein LBW85_12690 [Deltaproteobacteria bacterium]|jgi:hypothetical protein|nr:hypothetical protein [Deltaproteobacteria bacterium]